MHTLLRILRMERGWSRLELAMRLGTRADVIAAIEDGLALPLPNFADDMAHLFRRYRPIMAAPPVTEAAS